MKSLIHVLLGSWAGLLLTLSTHNLTGWVCRVAAATVETVQVNRI